MGFGKYIRKGLGIAGKSIMSYANNMTGGLAGKVLDKSTDLVSKHAGLIGKVANTVGQHFLSEDTRNKISNYADKALKYIPEGNIKSALSKVNNIAQGRDVNYVPPKKNKSKSGPTSSTSSATPKAYSINKENPSSVKNVVKTITKAVPKAGVIPSITKTVSKAISEIPKSDNTPSSIPSATIKTEPVRNVARRRRV